ncbi:hypothetical protein MAR_002525, partial [Mya arenaria]
MGNMLSRKRKSRGNNKCKARCNGMNDNNNRTNNDEDETPGEENADQAINSVGGIDERSTKKSTEIIDDSKFHYHRNTQTTPAHISEDQRKESSVNDTCNHEDLKNTESKTVDKTEKDQFRKESDFLDSHADENNRANNDDDETEMKVQFSEEDNANRSVSKHIDTHSDEGNRTHNDDDETKLKVQLPEKDIVDRSISRFCEIDTH